MKLPRRIFWVVLVSLVWGLTACRAGASAPRQLPTPTATGAPTATATQRPQPTRRPTRTPPPTPTLPAG
ncbi:MAG: cyclic nucleotide-binding protein, partial [Chloroflexi bacterium]|nr:cyclic nucleotide-binding protein [Chloroflexota bacterium]